MSAAAGCPWCGADELEAGVDLLELWLEERAFQLTACCQEAYQEAVDDMQAWDRKRWRAWIWERAGIYVRQVYSDLGWWRFDYGLQIRPVDWQTARQHVQEHHRHHQPPRGWKYGLGAYNGHELVAVAIVGRPVSRVLAARGWLEVTRLAVARKWENERALVWNACSQLYGAAHRRAAELGALGTITYTLVSESGGSVKAAGYEAVATTKGGSWSCPSRPRVDRAPTCRKTRWEKRTQAVQN